MFLRKTNKGRVVYDRKPNPWKPSDLVRVARRSQVGYFEAEPLVFDVLAALVASETDYRATEWLDLKDLEIDISLSGFVPPKDLLKIRDAEVFKHGIIVVIRSEEGS